MKHVSISRTNLAEQVEEVLDYPPQLLGRDGAVVVDVENPKDLKRKWNSLQPTSFPKKKWHFSLPEYLLEVLLRAAAAHHVQDNHEFPETMGGNIFLI